MSLKTPIRRQDYTDIYRERVRLALGKRIPRGAEVHHVDGDYTNNENTNLVLCPNRAYHKLLHIRTEAYVACGNANFRKCAYCRVYDSPSNLWQRFGTEIYRHYTCHS